MTVTSTGTGTLTLGVASSGWRAFSASPAVPDGTMVSYRIDDTGGAWELGVGTYTVSGLTLTRTLRESSTGSLLSVTTSATVTIVALAEDFIPSSNWTATAAPTTSNDITQGYAVGSQWLWVARGISWVCLDATTGAAVWQPVSNIVNPIAAAAGPVVFEQFDHFRQNQASPLIGTTAFTTGSIYNENGSTQTTNAYVTGTTVDAQTGVWAVRFAAGASIQRPTLAFIDNLSNVTFNSGLTHIVAASIRLRPAAASTAPSATNDYSVSLGFGPQNSDRTPNSFIKLDYYFNGTSIVFEARTRENSGSVVTTNLTVPASDTWVTWAIIVNGLNVEFWVGGTRVATRTLTANNLNLRPMLLGNQVTSAAGGGFDVDWALVSIRGMTR